MNYFTNTRIGYLASVIAFNVAILVAVFVINDNRWAISVKPILFAFIIAQGWLSIRRESFIAPDATWRSNYAKIWVVVGLATISMATSYSSPIYKENLGNVGFYILLQVLFLPVIVSCVIKKNSVGDHSSEKSHG